MSVVGTTSNPLRVAIIGAGPAGFYTAGHFFKQSDLSVEVDLYDKLPTPFGLVRAGVAPDHQKIKSVTRVYDKTASMPGFRFFGNVELGKHIHVDDLRDHYHQICYTTGAQVDRRLGIPGEDLEGSHSATDFVAWYNGHPEYAHLKFDLSQERVGIVGVGNVAVDVARILCRTYEELAATDIADYALEALRESKVREVYMLGRRGPAQAAFTNPEAKELGELPGADICVLPQEATLDAASQAFLDANPDRKTQRKVEFLQDFAQRVPEGKPRKLTLRFLVSPVELSGDEAGRVNGMRLVKNELYQNEAGQLRPRQTDTFEDLPVGLVFRSVGYRGVALAGVPFYDRWGIIPSDGGRVLDSMEGEPVLGEYAAGWIKRGPSGVIGTNKACAVETVKGMLEDLGEGKILNPSKPERSAIDSLIEARQPDYFTYEDWKRLDEMEIKRGEAQGRPRVKYIWDYEMLEALERTSA